MIIDENLNFLILLDLYFGDQEKFDAFFCFYNDGVPCNNYFLYIEWTFNCRGLFFYKFLQLYKIICKFLNDMIFTKQMKKNFHYCFKSKKVSNAFWNCQWYNMDQDCTKDIIFCIKRSQKPLCLRAGAFVTFGNNTLTEVSFLI